MLLNPATLSADLYVFPKIMVTVFAEYLDYSQYNDKTFRVDLKQYFTENVSGSSPCYTHKSI